MLGRYEWVLKNILPTDRVLDVGCCIEDKYFDDMWSMRGGRKPLHRLICDRAGSVTGLDFNYDKVMHMREMGYDVYCGNAEDVASYISYRFDVIVASEVVEHLIRPISFLLGARSLLRPGGKIVITTPNAYGFWSFVTYGILGRAETYTGHTMWLCEKYLRELARRADLHTESVVFLGPDPGRRRYKYIKTIPERIPRLRPILGAVLKCGLPEKMEKICT